MPRIYTDPKPPVSTVKSATKAAVAALKALGLASCICGGYACYLNGNTRKPNDLDLVVLGSSLTHSQEQLKRDIVRIDSDFYTVASKNPYATYRVLWFKPSLTNTLLTIPCKVDLLLLGVMNIPPIPSSRIKLIDGLPCAPLPVVFLLKLQSWEDHTQAPKEYLRVKQHVDVADIDRMMPCIVRQWSTTFVKECQEWMPALFVSEAKRRVQKYVTRFPAQKSNWQALGFHTNDDSSLNSLLARFTNDLYLD
jgi:hypothetical protein